MASVMTEIAPPRPSTDHHHSQPRPRSAQGVSPSHSTTSNSNSSIRNSYSHPPSSGSGSASTAAVTHRTTLEAPAPASASPFPSPSSSFLPPPTPGAHEFAMKPPPHRESRKASLANSLLGLGINGVNGHGTEVHLALSNATPSSANGTLPMSTSKVDAINGQPSEPLLLSKDPAQSPPTFASPFTPSAPADTPPTTTITTSHLLPADEQQTAVVLSPVTPTPASLGFEDNSTTTGSAVSSLLGRGEGGGSDGGSKTAITTTTTTAPMSSAPTNMTTTTTTSATPTPPRPIPSRPNSRPPSTYFSPDFSITPSRPAPASPALSATASPSSFGHGKDYGSPPSAYSPKLSKRLSVRSNRSLSGDFDLDAPSSPNPDSAAAPGSGTRSRPTSGLFLSRANSKRHSQLSSFVLPSPLGSPTAFGGFGSGVSGNASASATKSGQGIFAALQEQQQQPKSGEAEADEDGKLPLTPRPRQGQEADVFGASASSIVVGDREEEEGPASAPVVGSFSSSSHQQRPSTSSQPRSRPLSQSNSQLEPQSHSRTTSQSQLVIHSRSSSIKIRHNTPIVHIKIKDFAFPEGDERRVGLGVDVPKSNRVKRLMRKLAKARGGSTPRASTSSGSGTDTDTDTSEEEEEEEEDDISAWAAFRNGHGFWSANFNNAGMGSSTVGGSSASKGDGPSQSELNQNFLAGDEDFDDDDFAADHRYAEEGEDAEEEEEDVLYPGVYRALYAFEPEGTAEVALEEDQLVYVVGRGGSVGWAVVEIGWKPSPELVVAVKESEGIDVKGSDGAEGGGGGVDVMLQDGRRVRHGLVPEGYLTPVQVDVDV